MRGSINFNKSLKWLDLFLPSQLITSNEVPLLYRARTIVGINIVSLLASTALFIAILLMKLSLPATLGVFFCILTFLAQLYYFKKIKKNFEFFLVIGASVQISIISLVIYLIAFSDKGMGYFGLIWLIPVFTMIAFYFKTKYSLYFATIHFLIFLGITSNKFDLFFKPLIQHPHFAKTFLLFLILILVFGYFVALLFVHLSEELQTEVDKQRELLVVSAKFQSLGQMASNLAHDINNPLFMIQGKLHQMRNLLSRDQLDLERCDQIVESVEATLLRLSQIVKGISTFAREGRGDQMISLSLKDLIEGNLALSIDRIKNSGIELEIKIDPKLTLICYPSFISQVLLNLLNNAIDALENAQTKKIKVEAFLEKNWINISVYDSGLGISRDIENKIFEPFFTTKKFGKGTGLGLSISKGLIQVHEGELVYNRQGNMTCFTVRLPSYEEA